MASTEIVDSLGGDVHGSVEVVPTSSYLSALNQNVIALNQNIVTSRNELDGSLGASNSSNSIVGDKPKRVDPESFPFSASKKEKKRSSILGLSWSKNSDKHVAGKKMPPRVASSRISSKGASSCKTHTVYPPLSSPSNPDVEFKTSRSSGSDGRLTASSVSDSEASPTEASVSERPLLPKIKEKKEPRGKFRLFRRSVRKKEQLCEDETTRLDISLETSAVDEEPVVEIIAPTEEKKKPLLEKISLVVEQEAPAVQAKAPVLETISPVVQDAPSTPPSSRNPKKAPSEKGTPSSLALTSSTCSLTTPSSEDASSVDATEVILRDLGGGSPPDITISRSGGSGVSREAVAAAIDDNKQEIIRTKANRYRRKAQRLLRNLEKEGQDSKTATASQGQNSSSSGGDRRRKAERAFHYAAEARRLMDLIQVNEFVSSNGASGMLAEVEGPRKIKASTPEEASEAIEVVGKNASSENSVVITCTEAPASSPVTDDSSDSADDVSKTVKVKETTKKDTMDKVVKGPAALKSEVEKQAGAFYVENAQRIMRTFSEGPSECGSADIYSAPLESDDDSRGEVWSGDIYSSPVESEEDSVHKGCSSKSLGSLSARLRQEYSQGIDKYVSEDVANSFRDRVRTGIESLNSGISNVRTEIENLVVDLTNQAVDNYHPGFTSDAEGSSVFLSGSTTTTVSRSETMYSSSAGDNVMSFDASEATGQFTASDANASTSAAGSSAYGDSIASASSSEFGPDWVPQTDSRNA